MAPKIGQKRQNRPDEESVVIDADYRPPAKRCRTDNDATKSIKPRKIKVFTPAEISAKKSELGEITYDYYRAMLQQETTPIPMEFTDNEIALIISSRSYVCNVRSIIKHYQRLRQLQFSCADMAIITFGCGNITRLFETFANNGLWWDEFGISQNELVKIVSYHGGNNTLQYLRKHWTNLRAFLDKNDIMRIACHDGAKQSLKYLHRNWTDLTAILDKKKLLTIASKNGSKQVLICLKDNWANLLDLLGKENLIQVAVREGACQLLQYLLDNKAIFTEPLLYLTKKRLTYIACQPKAKEIFMFINDNQELFSGNPIYQLRLTIFFDNNQLPLGNSHRFFQSSSSTDVPSDIREEALSVYAMNK